jgi:cytochrome c553
MRNKTIFILSILLLMIAICVSFTDNLSATHKFHTDNEIRAFKNLRQLPIEENTFFAASGLCSGCHGSDPNGIAMIDPLNGEDINIADDWAGTMMANSARDPFWRAKVSHEILVNPSHQSLLETKCLSCHAPVGHYNAFYLNQSYTLNDFDLDSVGIDGVNCSSCHQLKDTLIGKRFSGELFYDTNKIIYGPYANPFAGPMQSFVGYTPAKGNHISKAGLCAGCHTLLTKTVDLSGNLTGNKFVEQATYHEWLNSIYNDTVSCQSCHIPQIDRNVIISTNYTFLPPRRPYGKHHLIGGNEFMLKLMRNNIQALNLVADAKSFDSAIVRTTRYLRNQTLDINLNQVNRTTDTVFYELTLLNKAGHKFPSGYPSRRAYVEFVVMDASGDTLFKSGILNNNYELINQNPTYEQHYNLINSEQQVQIYEMVMADVNGNVTTVLERANTALKDNRIPPKGFTTTHYAYDTAVIAGNALNDPDFNKQGMQQGTGQDIIHFHIPLYGYTGNLNVTARVYYQAAPRRWMDEMFSYSSPQIDLFKNLYNSADHTPSLVAEVMMGDMFTSVNELNPGNTISIFPNPTSESFVKIYNPQNEKINSIEIYDLNGKLHQKIQPINQHITLPNISGTYLIVIKTNTRYVTRKVVYIKP